MHRPVTSTTQSQPQLPLEKIRASGESIADWADRHGFERKLVYSILTGNRKCLRGQSFKIAVALGLKPAQSQELG